MNHDRTFIGFCVLGFLLVMAVFFGIETSNRLADVRANLADVEVRLRLAEARLRAYEDKSQNGHTK